MPAPVDSDGLDWHETDRGETRFRRKRLARAAGGEDLGASLYAVPPGARTWPLHYHAGNEEAIYVLAGEGTLRLGGGDDVEEHALGAGDYVALPTGEDHAHQVVNDGEEPLRLLMVSTMDDPDVTVYPEMDKVGVYAGSPPGGESDARDVHGYWRLGDDVDYWE